MLEYTHSLKDETLDRGLSMSSKVIETNLTIDTHNILGMLIVLWVIILLMKLREARSNCIAMLPKST